MKRSRCSISGRMSRAISLLRAGEIRSFADALRGALGDREAGESGRSCTPCDLHVRGRSRLRRAPWQRGARSTRSSSSHVVTGRSSSISPRAADSSVAASTSGCGATVHAEAAALRAPAVRAVEGEEPRIEFLEGHGRSPGSSSRCSARGCDSVGSRDARGALADLERASRSAACSAIALVPRSRARDHDVDACAP